jgi:pimeloyl-ACP methyl ester carboxylesterase
VPTVQFAEVPSGRVAFAAAGAGPGLVVPWLNFPWLDTPWVDALARDFAVVVAAPRGYARSSRLAIDDDDAVDLLRNDLLAVADAAGLDRFSILGYSLSGAVAAWLGTVESRIDRVVAGGFPLLGSYARVLDAARHDAAEVRSVEEDFDPRAALAFYAHLATLPDGALVDRQSRTPLAYWGSDDEVLARFGALTKLAFGLRERGVRFRVLDGLDHTGALLAFETVMPWIVEELRS